MRVDVRTHDSRLLGDNPLGDASTRELVLLLPPSYDSEPARRYPLVLLLAGYGRSGWELALNRGAWSPSLSVRLGDAMRQGRIGECIVALPDCFTRYGGSQYVDSPAIGRYQSYLADEIVPWVDANYRTIARRDGRAVIGKSSGGYGALVLAMQRPELFGAVAAHAADGAFEVSYARDLPATMLTLEARGGIAGFLSWFEEQPAKSSTAFAAMSHLCCAAAWSPSPELAGTPYGFGRGFDFPVAMGTGAFIPDVWARWLAWDPIHMVEHEQLRDGLGGLRALFLDAGRRDEYNLQLATRQLKARLDGHGIACTHEEFDGGHGNSAYRYERSFAVVTAALARD